MVNLLPLLLDAREDLRLSSLKLALICQMQDVILGRTVVKAQTSSVVEQLNAPPFENEEQVLLKDRLAQVYYEGQLSGSIREGSGKLFRLKPDGGRQIIYEGSWLQDLPEGKGRLLVFGSDWYYEGQLEQGIFWEFGQIQYKGKLVYEGTWYSYILFSNETWVVRTKEPQTVQIDSSLLIQHQQNSL